MAYDFDWAGETITLGDEEAQTFVLPIEPGVNRTGVDSPGSLAGFTDFTNHGVWNGAFRLGPPDPTANITPATSTAASNFMPHWRFIQSSNTNITASQARATSSPSGSNLRFTFASGAAGDEAYAEQLVDIGGSRRQWVADLVRSVVIAGTSNTGTFTAEQRIQYLNVDGGISGMPSEQSVTKSLSAGSTAVIFDTPDTTTERPPGSARFLRIRLIAKRGAAADSATGTIDFCDVRRDRSTARVRVLDQDTPQTYYPTEIFQTDGVFTVNPYGGGIGKMQLGGALEMIEQASAPAAPTTSYGMVWPDSSGRLWSQDDAGAKRLLSVQVVALPFVYVDIPASATTELNPSDNDLNLAPSVPRILMPWEGSIVGLAYRLSGAPTAGTIRVQATVAGASVWDPFGAMGTGAATADTAHQAPGTDTFTTTDGLGVQVVTSGAYTPATRDIHVTLFVALDYDGA